MVIREVSMRYRKLGRTDIDTSIIGLGGEWFNNKPQELITEVIHTAMDKGVNYIDIFMPQPEVRTAIGNSLVGRRDKIIIQGHLCTIMQNEQYERTRDIVETISSFEDLLNRLQTNYIDVGMIHYVDSFEDYDIVFNGDIIEYAKLLKRNGIIKHIGVSSHNPLVALKMVASGLVDVLMFSINPAYDLEDANADVMDLIEHKGLSKDALVINDARRQLYATCENLGVGITVMKALGAGTLLNAKSSPFGKAMSVAQCCHYSLSRPAVTSVLVGCSNTEELNKALCYLNSTDEEKDYTEVLSGSGKIKATGRCMYCNHCLPCPAGINIAEVTKFLDVAKQSDEIPPTIMSHYNMLDADANDCIMCGKCEKNCPFSVNIRENMKTAKKLFEN